MAALFLAVTATFAIADSASAALPGGLIQLRNAAFNQCIDAPGGAHNVVLKLSPCDKSVSSRVWRAVPTGEPNTYFIVNQKGNECMEVNNGTSTPGEAVDEFTCNRMGSERWVSEGLTLRHAGTNQCLDTVSGPGSTLMQFTCGQEAPPGVQEWLPE
jgi:hypothetical protein